MKRFAGMVLLLFLAMIATAGCYGGGGGCPMVFVMRNIVPNHQKNKIAGNTRFYSAGITGIHTAEDQGWCAVLGHIFLMVFLDFSNGAVEFPVSFPSGKDRLLACPVFLCCVLALCFPVIFSLLFKTPPRFSG